MKPAGTAIEGPVCRGQHATSSSTVGRLHSRLEWRSGSWLLYIRLANSETALDAAEAVPWWRGTFVSWIIRRWCAAWRLYEIWAGRDRHISARPPGCVL